MTTPIETAAIRLLELTDAWLDNASAFTCSEIEAIADLYRAAGRTDEASYLIDRHAAGDDEGDAHYTASSEDER